MLDLRSLDEPMIRWSEEDSPVPNSRAFRHVTVDLVAIIEDKKYGEGDENQIWRHVSMSCPNRVPSYEELCACKRDFIGDNAKAFMVFPAKDEHVNIHSYCLHLWAPTEKDILPDFSIMIGGMRGI